jgi:hypothetical protein
VGAIIAVATVRKVRQAEPTSAAEPVVGA